MFHISKNKCVGCGLCQSVRPEAIDLVNGVAVIKEQDEECLEKAAKVCPQKAIKDIKRELVFAIGTDEGEIIKQDDHVGMSKYYLIWKYSNGNLIFKEKRENIKYQEDEARIHGDPEKAKAVSSVLKGVDVIVGRMFGPNIIRMRKKFVPVIVREPSIEKAIEIIKENINEIVEEYNKEERRRLILK